MGDMTIRGLEDRLLRELEQQASAQGLDPQDYAAELLRQSLASRRRSRSEVARRIVASQPTMAETESVVFIREDRDSR